MEPQQDPQDQPAAFKCHYRGHTGNVTSLPVGGSLQVVGSSAEDA